MRKHRAAKKTGKVPGKVGSSWNVNAKYPQRERTATEGQILPAPTTNDLLLIQDQTLAYRPGIYASRMSEIDVVKQFRGEEQNEPLPVTFMCNKCRGHHPSLSCREDEWQPSARALRRAMADESPDQ